MFAFFTIDQSLGASSKQLIGDLLGRSAVNRTICFSARSREYLFPLGKDQTGSAFCPLPPRILDGIVIDSTFELFRTTMSEDWLVSITGALKPNKPLFLSKRMLDLAVEANRLPLERIVALLGTPQDDKGEWLQFRRPHQLPSHPLSVLGAYHQARGDFVLNAIFGGSISGAAPDRLAAFLGTIADEVPTTEPLRLPRQEIVRIVKGTRESKFGPSNPASDVRPPRRTVWSFKEDAERITAHTNSWSNYLLPGTFYKASALASVIRQLFDTSRPLSFLEHGGYAGLLSMQLLAERDLNIQRATCCEVDSAVLLNTRELASRLGPYIADRFKMKITSAEAMEYKESYDVIAFVHLLLYLRRDILSETLRRAYDALSKGGALVILENTKPPTTSGGVDDDIIFSPEELDAVLASIGSVEYFHSRTARRLETPDKSTACFRVLRRT